jgi:hypothetical protein
VCVWTTYVTTFCLILQSAYLTYLCVCMRECGWSPRHFRCAFGASPLLRKAATHVSRVRCRLMRVVRHCSRAKGRRFRGSRGCGGLKGVFTSLIQTTYMGAKREVFNLLFGSQTALFVAVFASSLLVLFLRVLSVLVACLRCEDKQAV